MSESSMRRSAVKQFAERWQSEEGNEERQARSFWIELFRDVLGVPNPTRILDFERKVRKRRIDVYCDEYGILIENKSRGVRLDQPKDTKYGRETAYGQACWYRQYMAKNPNWIITCNFDEICIYNMRSGDSIPYEGQYEARIMLRDLPDQYHILEKLTDRSTSRLEVEKRLSVDATRLVGEMYDALMKQYRNIETDRKEQHDLNVLIVRLVFLLYAEDAGLLQSHQAFLKYMQDFRTEYYRDALVSLFRVLNTPKEERCQYDSEKLKAFPYVNGGLFAEEIAVPQFSDEMARILTKASAEFDWKDISPTIFGATFESTLNPVTRRSCGMHYTSVENIHRVIDPLFLDSLRKELNGIESIATQKTRIARLKEFRDKLATLKFLDPACGSGNFLTETYLCLRKLENLALIDLLKEDEDSGRSLYLGNESWQFGIKVSISQFYGIEINDFAVAVAKTALWIAEAQAKAETEELFGADLDILPLANNDNIIVANALRMDWNDLVPNTELSYIIGNPPFCGKKERSDAQNEDMDLCYGKNCDRTLDYVTCWFKYATEYMKGTDVRTALVSTKSVTQGEQIYIWDRLLKEGARISFAWRPFMWGSDSLSPANVVCVIIGFSVLNKRERERIRASSPLRPKMESWSRMSATSALT